jgi:release factor glutamine methyltransferase
VSPRSPITVGAALASARSTLARAGLESAALEARVLLGHVTSLTREQLIVEDARDLTPEEEARFEALVERRVAREPVAYLIGEKEFFGLRFEVNSDTLVPRPDTETLVEAVLKFCKTLEHGPRILDLGTGSGVLLLAVLHGRPQATGLGVDRSPGALKVATRNAKALGLDKRASFQEGNWTQGLEGPFDVIVTNPPYIPSRDMEGLMPDVRDFEPAGALDGGPDGLCPMRTIARDAGPLFAPGGLFCCEIGQGQAETAARILIDNGFGDVKCVPDLNGIARCVCGYWTE